MLLCSGRSNLKKYLLPILLSNDGSFYFTQDRFFFRNKSCSCTTCIVYVNLFKDRFFYVGFLFRKADAKVRTLKHIFQIFSEVFLFFFFSLSSSSLLSKGRQKEKGRKPGHRFLKEECQLALLSFSKAGAKVRTLKHNFQMFPEVFFIFLFQDRSSERNLWQRREKWKLTAPFYCQNVKTSPPSFPKADAKVGLLRTSAKYIQAFFEGLRELFHN